MDKTPENIEQAKEDHDEYLLYLKEMKENNPEIKPLTFKERYGYEIVLYEGGGFEFKGERYDSSTTKK